MDRRRRRWMPVLLLAAWLGLSGPGRAAETSAPPPASTAGETPTKPSQEEAPPPAQTRPAVKAPARKAPPARPREPFRPSEEIHVDKAVDFPADI